MRIAIVAGGRTPERDVSLRSGRRMTLSLGELHHEAWLVDPAEVPLVESLAERRPDLCWLALHGKEGEDRKGRELKDDWQPDREAQQSGCDACGSDEDEALERGGAGPGGLFALPGSLCGINTASLSADGDSSRHEQTQLR